MAFVQGEVDWLGLWRELVLGRRNQLNNDDTAFSFHDKERARQYEVATRRKNREKKDALLDFVRQNLGSTQTVLDIGAGTGRWTLPLAKVARRVTAVEPSAAMLGILRENAATARADNIDTVQSTWDEAAIECHDIAVCAHAMYSSPDLAAFVGKMEQYARKRCYLAMRLFPSDGIMSELARSIYGLPSDSPNFIIAYNALYSLGIYANVLVEESNYHWTNHDIESALARAKRHLHLGSNTEYDELIHRTLVRRLINDEGAYRWPDGMHSALLWWQIK